MNKIIRWFIEHPTKNMLVVDTLKKWRMYGTFNSTQTKQPYNMFQRFEYAKHWKITEGKKIINYGETWINSYTVKRKVPYKIFKEYALKIEAKKNTLLQGGSGFTTTDFVRCCNCGFLQFYKSKCVLCDVEENFKRSYATNDFKLVEQRNRETAYLFLEGKKGRMEEQEGYNDMQILELINPGVNKKQNKIRFIAIRSDMSEKDMVILKALGCDDDCTIPSPWHDSHIFFPNYSFKKVTAETLNILKRNIVEYFLHEMIETITKNPMLTTDEKIRKEKKLINSHLSNIGITYRCSVGGMRIYNLIIRPHFLGQVQLYIQQGKLSALLEEELIYCRKVCEYKGMDFEMWVDKLLKKSMQMLMVEQ